MNEYNLTYYDIENHSTRTVYLQGNSLSDIEQQFFEKHGSRKQFIIVYKIRLITDGDPIREREFLKLERKMVNKK